MIPLKDYNPTRTFPVVTLLLMAACIGVYFLVQQDVEVMNEAEFTYRRAAIPCEVVTFEPLSAQEVVEGRCLNGGEPVFDNKSVVLAVLTSMFLHGGLLHLGGNMLYLWVFGNNIEDRQGKLVYLAFYVLAGIVATAAHVAVDPTSTIPVVGASGAIAGVMGAYLVLFPRVPIRSLIIFFFILMRDIEARWLLGIWFVSQFFINPSDGVAWAAHVGGFAFGVLVGLIWRRRQGPRGFGRRGLEPVRLPDRPAW